MNDLYKRAEVEPNNNQNIICEIHNTRLRLQKIMQYKTKGAILRSKVRWHESSERNTRYFYNLEKQNYEKKTMTKLKRSLLTLGKLSILLSGVSLLTPLTILTLGLTFKTG